MTTYETDLSKTYTPRQASEFTNPLNGNDPLPLVYGDLTMASGIAGGHWTLPAIDTTAYVYCYADHPVLSTANGNSVTIYTDGTVIGSGYYTFNEDDAAYGNIATITFTSSQGFKQITAKGKGKSDPVSSSSLVSGIPDIVFDFLTDVNSFDPDIIEPISMARARSDFSENSYSAAGVIDSKISLWTALTQMMGSFLGSVYQDSSGLLVLGFETGQVPSSRMPVVGVADFKFISAELRLQDLLNNLTLNYKFNHVVHDFLEKEELADSISAGLYGDRAMVLPLYWCYHQPSANDVAYLLMDLYKNPTWRISFQDLSLKRSRLDVGDFLAVTIKPIYGLDKNPMVNQICKISEVRARLDKGIVGFVVQDTGSFLEDENNNRDMTLY